MELNEFAKSILFGGQLVDKISDPILLTDSIRYTETAKIPLFPARSPVISFRKKKEKRRVFPTTGDLALKKNRGFVLHFFANHELLALELMALLLLKFPDAPLSFRRGIGETMREEQTHLRLYLDRMQDLGVDFGDAPLNDYFWNCIAKMKTPLEFIANLSLTFEQGNLDYSCKYREIFLGVEDLSSAEIMKQVYEDEIGHVQHGLKWFNSLRRGQLAKMNEWEAYKYLLIPPLTPARAKGSCFYPESRYRVGFSQVFVRSLQSYRTRKGHPPSLWFFNPDFEDSLAGRIKAGHSKQVNNDLCDVFAILAAPDDILISESNTSNCPALSTQMQSLGFHQPKKRSLKSISKDPNFDKISSFEPWGWSSESYGIASTFVEVMTNESKALRSWLKKRDFNCIPQATLNSKNWASEKLSEFKKSLDTENKAFLGSLDLSSISCKDQSELASGLAYFANLGVKECLLKDPFGVSGRGQKKLSTTIKIDPKTMAWAKKIMAKRAIIVEAHLDNHANYSVQLRISDEGQVNILGISRFLTSTNRCYMGHCLGSRQLNLDKKIVIALHQKNRLGKSIWDIMRYAANFIGLSLAEAGYFGPAGIDALIYRSETGQFFVKPIVEVNCRYTMGHCALKIESMLASKTNGLLLIKPYEKFFVADHPVEQAFEFNEKWAHSHPMQLDQDSKLAHGFTFLSNPKTAQKIQAGLMLREQSFFKSF